MQQANKYETLTGITNLTLHYDNDRSRTVNNRYPFAGKAKTTYLAY